MSGDKVEKPKNEEKQEPPADNLTKETQPEPPKSNNDDTQKKDDSTSNGDSSASDNTNTAQSNGSDQTLNLLDVADQDSDDPESKKKKSKKKKIEKTGSQKGDEGDTAAAALKGLLKEAKDATVNLSDSIKGVSDHIAVNRGIKPITGTDTSYQTGLESEAGNKLEPVKFSGFALGDGQGGEQSFKFYENGIVQFSQGDKTYNFVPDGEGGQQKAFEIQKDGSAKPVDMADLGAVLTITDSEFKNDQFSKFELMPNGDRKFTLKNQSDGATELIQHPMNNTEGLKWTRKLPDGKSIKANFDGTFSEGTEEVREEVETEVTSRVPELVVAGDIVPGDGSQKFLPVELSEGKHAEYGDFTQTLDPKTGDVETKFENSDVVDSVVRKKDGSVEVKFKEDFKGSEAEKKAIEEKIKTNGLELSSEDGKTVTRNLDGSTTTAYEPPKENGLTSETFKPAILNEGLNKTERSFQDRKDGLRKEVETSSPSENGAREVERTFQVDSSKPPWIEREKTDGDGKVQSKEFEFLKNGKIVTQKQGADGQVRTFFDGQEQKGLKPEDAV